MISHRLAVAPILTTRRVPSPRREKRPIRVGHVQRRPSPNPHPAMAALPANCLFQPSRRPEEDLPDPGPKCTTIPVFRRVIVSTATGRPYLCADKRLDTSEATGFASTCRYQSDGGTSTSRTFTVGRSGVRLPADRLTIATPRRVEQEAVGRRSARPARSPLRRRESPGGPGSSRQTVASRTVGNAVRRSAPSAGINGEDVVPHHPAMPRQSAAPGQRFAADREAAAIVSALTVSKFAGDQTSPPSRRSPAPTPPVARYPRGDASVPARHPLPCGTGTTDGVRVVPLRDVAGAVAAPCALSRAGDLPQRQSAGTARGRWSARGGMNVPAQD